MGEKGSTMVGFRLGSHSDEGWRGMELIGGLEMWILGGIGG